MIRIVGFIHKFRFQVFDYYDFRDLDGVFLTKSQNWCLYLGVFFRRFTQNGVFCLGVFSWVYKIGGLFLVIFVCIFDRVFGIILKRVVQFWGVFLGLLIGSFNLEYFFRVVFFVCFFWNNKVNTILTTIWRDINIWSFMRFVSNCFILVFQKGTSFVIFFLLFVGYHWK